MDWEIAKDICRTLTPRQGGALTIGFLVIAFLLGDLRRFWSRRNLVVLLLLIAAPFLVNLIDTWERRADNLGATWVFSGLFAATAIAMIASLVAAFRSRGGSFRLAGKQSGLRVILTVLLIVNVFSVFGRPPDDCGYYSNLGAQRWRETGSLPYGDPLLRGPRAPGMGAAATYGPLLYAAHIPFQMLLDVQLQDANKDPQSPLYTRATVTASQLACLFFHLLGVWALLGIGKRLGGGELGLTLATLYCGSPYIFGLGGETTVIGGLPFIFHIAPTAMILLALRFAHRPLLAGLLLALASGVLFFPAFYFPLWLGWYLWRGQGARNFLIGFAICGAALAALVWFNTNPTPERNPAQLFLECTLEHQEGGDQSYGQSRFGFWGQHPTLAEFWQKPIAGKTSLLKPTFLGFAALALLAGFLARGRSLAGLAALCGALGAGIQLWKTHAAGSYVEWYYPFLVIGLLADAREARAGPGSES